MLRAARFVGWLVLLIPVLAAGQSPGPAAAVLSADEQFARIHNNLSVQADEMISAGLPFAGESAKPVAAQPDLREQYQAEGPAALTKAAARVRLLMPVIAPILREEGVPAELAGVVLVESGGLPAALSPKGARGLWQFMPATARRYGLVVSAERDDRLDVDKSTRAAARYLRDLRGQFGTWELVFAAYNAGEQTLTRALSRSRVGDFSAVKAFLPMETQNYVPAVTSAVELLKTGNWEASGKALVLFAEARF